MWFLGQKKQKGFTLIELMVSVGLFAVVMTVSVGTLLALIDANRKAQSIKSIMNNLNFALDSMTRTVRTGIDYYCDDVMTNGSLPSGTQGCSTGGARLVLTNDQGERVGYRYRVVSGNGRVERNVDNAGWIQLTASEIDITDMQFYATGITAGNSRQPLVTIAMSGVAGRSSDTNTEFNVQTTVTQRLLDL